MLAAAWLRWMRDGNAGGKALASEGQVRVLDRVTATAAGDANYRTTLQFGRPRVRGCRVRIDGLGSLRRSTPTRARLCGPRSPVLRAGNLYEGNSDHAVCAAHVQNFARGPCSPVVGDEGASAARCGRHRGVRPARAMRWARAFDARFIAGVTEVARRRRYGDGPR